VTAYPCGHAYEFLWRLEESQINRSYVDVMSVQVDDHGKNAREQ